MSSSRRAQDTSQQTPAAGLKVTLPVLVTASVLFLAALVLAYLGGVMTGRAQWASSLEESRASGEPLLSCRACSRRLSLVPDVPAIAICLSSDEHPIGRSTARRDHARYQD